MPAIGAQHSENEGKTWFACYLGNSRAAVAAHRLNPFGIKHGLLLVKALIHVAHVTLLCLQNAGQVHLRHRHTHTQINNYI